MASANTLCAEIINVKGTVVTNHEFYNDSDGIKHLRIHVRPNKWHENDCPICHRKCAGDGLSSETRTWRSLDFGEIPVELVSQTHYVLCREHGRHIAEVPWAYPGSRFTKAFDLTVGWLAQYLPKTTICEFMRIDYKTVGRCVKRTLDVVEPDRKARLNGLVNIGIDETSFRKGHKYITVIVNHDTNTVVWCHEGFGDEVLKLFFEELTPEQLSTIKVVTGDGAKYISRCVEKYLPGADRCVDPFHVVEWAIEALDEVRREAWRTAYEEAKNLVAEAKSNSIKKGHKDTQGMKIARAAQKKADEIKGSAYALGKNPENLTEKQAIRLELIAATNNRLYRAYMMKEELRLLLKIKNVEEAGAALKKWRWWASHSRITAFKNLSAKIKRNEKYILLTIKLGMSNARIESINNKIKVIIRRSYGFRNIENMLSMIYLVCSNLVIPIPNRKPKSRKAA